MRTKSRGLVHDAITGLFLTAKPLLPRCLVRAAGCGFLTIVHSLFLDANSGAIGAALLRWLVLALILAKSKQSRVTAQAGPHIVNIPDQYARKHRDDDNKLDTVHENPTQPGVAEINLFRVI